MTGLTGQRFRSTLMVPAHWATSRFDEAVDGCEPDRILLDLDDTVSPSQKRFARKNLEALVDHAQKLGIELLVRVNSPSHPACLEDLLAVAAVAQGSRIGGICLPRPGTRNAVVAIDWVLGQTMGDCEANLAMEVQLESPRELAIGHSISAATSRIRAVAFGHGDFADGMGLPFVSHTESSSLSSHKERVSELAMFQVSLAARSAQLVPIDGPHGNDGDFHEHCERARGLGYAGIWCVDRDQVEIANSTFSVSEDELRRAEAVLASTGGGDREPDDGSSYDAPQVNIARRILETYPYLTPKDGFSGEGRAG